MVIYHTLLHQINIAVKSSLKAISKSVKDTLKNWQSFITDKITEQQEPKRTPKKIVDDFSLYALSTVELVALSYGLDHQIPMRNNRNNKTTEVEYFSPKNT